ncbi:MAG: ornithine carbamoyltransferase, partial [Oscillospiraceae bacterium]|nr:ornithine carbamoyltransferase [Oscillospiraceae bacterium]
TVRELTGQLDGLKMCYLGDGNNMTNSLIAGGIKMGMQVAVACPQGYHPDQGIMDWAAENGAFTLTEDPVEAAKDADVLFTDVWASMGQEEEAEKRRQVFEGKYQINTELLRAAKPDAMVQHCLPAHRGEEITEEVFEGHAEEIFEEAENRLHAQKAVMVKLMG